MSTMVSASTAYPLVPTRPNVWEMPTTGIQWCDCGEDHEITQELIAEEMREILGSVGEYISHKEVCFVLMKLWRYVSVCAFFHDQVKNSAKIVNGEVAAQYRVAIAEEIIAHFSKTWNGCPEESCNGGLTYFDDGE